MDELAHLVGRISPLCGDMNCVRSWTFCGCSTRYSSRHTGHGLPVEIFPALWQHQKSESRFRHGIALRSLATIKLVKIGNGLEAGWLESSKTVRNSKSKKKNFSS